MDGTIGPSAANQMSVARMPVQQVEQANRDLSQVRPIVPPGASISDKKGFLAALHAGFEQTLQIAEEGQGEIGDMNADVSQEGQMAMASSYFDLTKVGQFDMAAPPMGSMDPMAQEPIADESQGLSFSSPQELQALLDQSAQDPGFVNKLLEATPDDGQTVVRDSIARYYEPNRDVADRAILAAEIFKAIHGRGQGEDQVKGEYTQASIENAVLQADKMIQQFAKKAASCKSTKKASSSFNLKKQAQQFHGTAHPEFFNYGPESKRILPWGNTGVVGNDWHVWLRAKDHSFIMDDHAVDFDTFWRGNIMDKYSQPYRNNKGEWVGGYLNKRFETDRNVPEGNNHQLLPGQRRRPYLPEFATMEARMEASRGKYAKERGYDPTDSEAKPYNWKEAGTVKKK